MSKLKLIDFIKENEDNYRELLTASPYNFKIDETDDLILFMYNMIESDMSLDIVQEARGIILEKGSWKVVCYPFQKFFNYGEENAVNIDWDTAKVQQKIDGSLIKLYYYKGEWRVSTKSKINAKDAYIRSDKYDTFYELFSVASVKSSLNFDALNKDYTYLFELVSPYNKVVIPYEEIDIYHIGTKNNKTLEEIEVDIGIKKPEYYNFDSLDEVIKNAKELPVEKEGYVVVDRNYNRIKIKSPKYVAMHNYTGGNLSDKTLLDIIMRGEEEEFLNYFSEYKDRIEEIKRGYHKLIKIVKDDIKKADIKKKIVKNRKEYALWAKEKILPSILFMYLDNRIDKKDVEKAIREVNKGKLINKIKEINNKEREKIMEKASVLVWYDGIQTNVSVESEEGVKEIKKLEEEKENIKVKKKIPINKLEPGTTIISF